VSSVIETLIEETRDSSTYVGDLATRARFLASTLRQKPVSEWLRQELDGYPEDAPVPVPYRQTSGGVLVAWRPGMGWVEAPITDAVNERLSRFEIRDGIRDLESNAMHQAGKRQMDIPVELPEERQLELRVETRLDTRLALVVPARNLQVLLATLRLGIRRWAEGLAAAGLQGSGTSFSKEDRSVAAAITDELDSLIEAAHAEARQQQAKSESAGQAGSFFSRLLGA